MKIYEVGFERGARRGEMVVWSTDVLKETALFYFIEEQAEPRYAFGYSSRVPKDRYATSAVEALARYITKRGTDRANAEAVACQAAGQIEQARSLLLAMDQPASVDAVDPSATSTGTRSTRDA